MKNLTLSVLFIISCLFCNSVFAQQSNVIDSLENVLKMAKEDTNKVEILLSLSKECLIKGKLECAMNYAQKAQILSEKLLFQNGMGRSYNRIGVIYEKKGIYPQALKYHIAALEIREKFADKKGIAESRNNLGIIYRKQGNYPEALKNHYTSLKLNEEIVDKKGIGLSHNLIGIVYKEQGNYSEALQNYLIYLKIAEETNDKKAMATAYGNIGTINKKFDNYSEALKNYNAAIKISQELGDKTGVSNGYMNMGVLYDHLGRISHKNGKEDEAKESYEEALRNYLVALEFKEEIGNKDEISVCSSNIGYSFTALKKYDEARIYLNKGLSLAKETGNLDYIKDSYGALAELDSVQAVSSIMPSENKIKFWMSAYSGLIKCLDITDSIFSVQNSKQIAELKILYETEKKDKEIELLSKENELKAVQVKQQHASLLASNLEAEKKQDQILLLNKSSEVKELQLSKTKDELKQQQTEAEKQAAEMAIFKKDRALNEQLLERQKLLRNGTLVGAALLVLLGALLFNRYHLRKKLEKQEALLKERKRISSDMHDDLASGLTSIRMLSEIAQNKANGQKIEEIAKISKSAETLMDNMRDIIWTMSAENNSLEDLVFYIRKYAGEFLDICGIEYRFDIPDTIPQVIIESEKKRNIFLSVKESLHNVAKHSGATLVTLTFKFDDGIHITVADNGKGFSSLPFGEGRGGAGNGMKNMKSRMEMINGSFGIQNKVGTTVKLSCPLDEKA